MSRPSPTPISNRSGRRATELLRLGEIDVDRGQDLLLASERTDDPLLRKFYLEWAVVKFRHGSVFRELGVRSLRTAPRQSKSRSEVHHRDEDGDHRSGEATADSAFLASVLCVGRRAIQRLAAIRNRRKTDEATRRLLDEILCDENLLMNSALDHLTRVVSHPRWILWRERSRYAWKSYLRIATGAGNLVRSLILTAQYFTILPLFAWLAKRSEKRDPEGWTPIPARADRSLQRQY